jgi:hypothetical protein
MTVEAFPLNWPEDWPRTPADRIGNSRFQTSFAVARDGLMEQIARLGGQHVVLSTNVRLKRDGLPYASDPEPDDGGVAVYFLYKGQSMCFACDKYWRVKENIQAIRLTIEALRGIERWGASDMMHRAFNGFMQLPAPGQTTALSWREVLGIAEGINDLEYIKHVYRRLSGERHPDRPGGSDEAMAELNRAWQQAQEALR